MTARDICTLLDAKVLCCGNRLDTQVDSAFGSDMMSDVLAFVKDSTVLLTGLVNSQSLRTAALMDLPCIVYVRGKRPAPDVIDMAEMDDILLLATEYSMYETCGRLFSAGLPGVDLGGK
ncbi:MAG: hypothetical protein E7334_02100 [Clostridiales bacterium]|nr:hypothetical protein [Clostridiales bacterium]MBQ2818079.1 hypothetical protein [Clostridia bacterium]MBQ4638268.1 hypothetical protein [Clostridia bacterium]